MPITGEPPPTTSAIRSRQHRRSVLIRPPAGPLSRRRPAGQPARPGSDDRKSSGPQPETEAPFRSPRQADQIGRQAGGRPGRGEATDQGRPSYLLAQRRRQQRRLGRTRRSNSNRCRPSRSSPVRADLHQAVTRLPLRAAFFIAVTRFRHPENEAGAGVGGKVQGGVFRLKITGSFAEPVAGDPDLRGGRPGTGDRALRGHNEALADHLLVRDVRVVGHGGRRLDRSGAGRGRGTVGCDPVDRDVAPARDAALRVLPEGAEVASVTRMLNPAGCGSPPPASRSRVRSLVAKVSVEVAAGQPSQSVSSRTTQPPITAQPPPGRRRRCVVVVGIDRRDEGGGESGAKPSQVGQPRLAPFRSPDVDLLQVPLPTSPITSRPSGVNRGPVGVAETEHADLLFAPACEVKGLSVGWSRYGQPSVGIGRVDPHDLAVVVGQGMGVRAGGVVTRSK